MVPTTEEWQQLVETELLAKVRQDGCDLVVIDPIAPFCQGENNASCAFQFLMPLSRLLDAGAAVLLMHHPGKFHNRVGQTARGSGAFLGHVDVSLEMRHPGGDPETRRRRIVAFSRFDQTPRDIVLELAEDGKSYARVADATSSDFEGWWRPLRQLFERAPQKLTRADVVMEWPDEAEKPASSTLLRLLKKAVAKGLLLCEGSGHKGDPCRYWLLDAEMRWREDPVYQLVESQRQEWGLSFESLQEKRALMQR